MPVRNDTTVVLKDGDALEIAEKLKADRGRVGRWRERFAKQGIEKDAPHGGRTPTARYKIVAKIIDDTIRRRPKNATHGSTHTPARELGTNPSRGWRANGLQPPLI